MSDKIDMIYDLLKQDREVSSDFRKEVRQSHIETGEKITQLSIDTSHRLTQIEATNTTQNEQLAEHMNRSERLEAMHGDHEGRIIVLEEPAKTMGRMKKWLIGVGAFAGAIVAICKLLGLF